MQQRSTPRPLCQTCACAAERHCAGHRLASWRDPYTKESRFCSVRLLFLMRNLLLMVTCFIDGVRLGVL